jgi:regulatory protein
VELTRKLRSRGFAPPAIAGVLDDLQRVRLVDDAAFAKAYGEQRTAGSRAVGRSRVAFELRRRGVAGDLIEAALDDADGVAPAAAEFERALEAGRRKWQSVRGQPGDRRAQAKIYRFLAGRGFSGDTCRQVIDRLGAADPAE